MLTVHKLKVTTLVRPDEILAVPVPNGQPRVILKVQLPDRVLSADIAAKSLRKVQTTVRELGADNVVIVLQGSLGAGDAIAEAGLSAQPKVKKEPAAA